MGIGNIEDLQGVILNPVSAPLTPVKGQMYYDSAANTVKTYDGTSWGISTTGINTGDQTSVSGNAGTATKLATARNINGVAFDGTSDITVGAGAAWGGITGTMSSQTDLTAALAGHDTLCGFPNRTDSTLSFNNSTRVFTVAPVGASFDVWVAGVKYTYTTAQTVTIPATVGALNYIFFTAAGIQQATSPWDIASDVGAPCATAYWSGTLCELGDERHSAYRNRALHKNLHFTSGARYDNGLAGTYGYTFSVASGTIWDEDIQLNISAQTTCRLWYRNASLQYIFEEGVVAPAKFVAPANTVQYDNNGVLTTVPGAGYVTNWIYATNDATYPIQVVVGTSYSALPGTDTAAAQPNLTGISTREWKLIATAQFQGTPGNAPFSVFVRSIDYRSSPSMAGGVARLLPAVQSAFLPSQNFPSAVVDVQSALTCLGVGVGRAGRSGNMMLGQFTASTSSATLTASRIYYQPFTVQYPVNVTGLAINCAPFTSSNTISLGIYSSKYVAGSGDTPDALLASGTVTVTGTGVFSTSISYTLQPGTLYWAAAIAANTNNNYTGVALGSCLSIGSSAAGSGWSVLFAPGSGSTLTNPATVTGLAGLAGAVVAPGVIATITVP